MSMCPNNCALMLEKRRKRRGMEGRKKKER